MRIALTHNLRTQDTPEQAEFDSEETISAIAAAMAAAGHDVDRVEVSGSASRVVSKLEALQPDLVFNTAEGRRGRTREAFFPALFDELAIPYTGSDAYTLTVSLDKALTKKVLSGYGVPSPRGRLMVRESTSFSGLDELLFPVIVKPNFEGSSKGIGQDSVVEDAQQLGEVLDSVLSGYPSGVLVEQYVAGVDISVPYLAGVNGGVLDPVEYVIDPRYPHRYEVYDYALKNQLSHFVQVRCPAQLPAEIATRAVELTKRVIKALEVRDLGRVDFRYGKDGKLYFLELNALPSLQPDAGLFLAAKRRGLDFDKTIQQVLNSACGRYGISSAVVRPKPRKKDDRVVVGFAFNMKRVDATGGDDSESEYDSPKTIDAIRQAIESFGHDVVMLEATSELPPLMADTPIDVVFNIAEGIRGRNREAQVPSLCELLGIPYTGSDSATLSICLDKGLTKKILLQQGILTPNFQVFVTGKERLQRNLRFPLIVKPNQEGSSKGIGDKSVVDSEEQLREAVRAIIDRYQQPALVEEYIPGREFTVGLLGERRPRVLPPMEIVFLDKNDERPVYDFAVKQDWKKQVDYVCPAHLQPAELRAIERIARDTFTAVDCRDVARVDLRLNARGELFVLEVNPLPGLTPGFSDLVMIGQAAGLDYKALIGEILSGGIKRLKEKRKDQREARPAEIRPPERKEEAAPLRVINSEEPQS